MDHLKNIYCLEGMWNDYNLKDKSTIIPMLDLLFKNNYCDYIYHDCATKEEFKFFITKWAKSTSVANKFPIIYLACHGKSEKIYLNRKDYITLDEIAELLKDKCHRKVFYFASCSTLSINKRKIQSFLTKTGAIAAIGYKYEVDWLIATACELLVLEALQKDKFDSKGIEKIRQKIFSDYGNLPKKVELRMEINETFHFPRTRKTNGKTKRNNGTKTS